MKIRQIKALQETGEQLLEKRQIPAALTCFKEVRAIMKEEERDSLQIFAQFCVYASLTPSFPLYAEFTARNNLFCLSEDDYMSVMQPQELIESP
jgi:hypothetical protein